MTINRPIFFPSSPGDKTSDNHFFQIERGNESSDFDNPSRSNFSEIQKKSHHY